jgi:NAD-dependent deacetylase
VADPQRRDSSWGGPIVVLTGAGISRESGLHTFRDADGIWATVRIEDVATPEAFARDPVTVQAFYNARRRGLLDPAVMPNAAHRALVELERAHGDVLVVTQNIDDLHERAGQRRLLHMHGELLKAICADCSNVTDCRADIAVDAPCLACGAISRLRPQVVWFGEMPFHMEKIAAALARCATFVAIGTSGNVYPASGFVELAHQAGARTIELNLEPSLTRSLFHEAHHGPATTVVPAFVARVLAGT